jgi:catechol 2,3-dioxygenase-like lactoylglutathione lyase family enzyme
MRWLFALLAALLSVPAAAQERVEPTTAADFGVRPWTEAVISVTDIPATTRLFREVGGWRVTHRGRVSRGELDYWRLPPQASARFERLCAPGADTGCLRFVRFSGVPQRPIRLAARAWDTGGIFSIMVRSDNVQHVFERAIAMGWWAESEPIRFRFGQSDLSNVVLTGPHGINLAIYQRHSPAFTAFPVGRISQAFNSMRMVRDRAASRRFYEQGLGFGVLFDSANEPVEPAFSNFGIPYNLTPRIPRAAAALQPVPGETGRVEVMQIEGFTGRDFSAFAVPPNLGILSVRYPIDSLTLYRGRLQARGIDTVFDLNLALGIPIAGIGLANIAAVRDPDGNLTEFYEHDFIIITTR